MGKITIEISEDEILKIAEAYKTLQNLLDKIISPNELYNDEFLKGLQEAQLELKNRDQ